MPGSPAVMEKRKKPMKNGFAKTIASSESLGATSVGRSARSSDVSGSAGRATLRAGALSARRGATKAAARLMVRNHLEGRKMSAIQDFSDGLGKERGEDPRVETYLGQEFWLLMRTLDKTSGPGLDDLRGGLLQLAAEHLEKGDARLPLTHWARASAAAPKSHLQPDFNVIVRDSFDASFSAVRQELNRFVPKSAESTST